MKDLTIFKTLDNYNYIQIYYYYVNRRINYNIFKRLNLNERY